MAGDLHQAEGDINLTATCVVAMHYVLKHVLHLDVSKVNNCRAQLQLLCAESLGEHNISDQLKGYFEILKLEFSTALGRLQEADTSMVSNQSADSAQTNESVDSAQSTPDDRKKDPSYRQ
ncbi:unnamed protein product [Sympodiomycopsis kandeliae]